jgi:hypothetical protein
MGIGAARLLWSRGSGACSVLAPFLRFHPTGGATKPLAGLFPNSCAIKIEEGGRIRHLFRYRARSADRLYGSGRIS